MSNCMVWLENNVFLLPKRLEKDHFFSETLAGISTLILWTPCTNLKSIIAILLSE